MMLEMMIQIMLQMMIRLIYYEACVRAFARQRATNDCYYTIIDNIILWLMLNLNGRTRAFT
jgi:hypothetical protein